MTETLKSQINTLIQLQAIDRRVYEFNLQLQTIPGSKSDLEQSLEAHKQRLKEAEDRLKGMLMRQKELENEMLSKETQVKKYQAQQAQVKTNQEYSALTQEISNANADKSLIEDDVLKLMDEGEAFRAVVTSEKKALETQGEKVKAGLKELDGRFQTIEAEIKNLNGQRSQYLSSVDPEILERYELILKKRDGVALSRLSSESCGECGVSLPPQVVNLIKIGEEILYCESCSRILYDESSQSDS
ncbi:MAG: hypothetical protein HQL11_05845 [Candidatus Omnitrophica bacterium]|nr:hypothetical protein [Candidatus Omnitrophota bacterium]